MTALLRVLVVEDHGAFRSMLCKLLRQRADVVVVGEAADGLDALRQAAALRPDVIVLDISLPKLNGIDLAGRLRDQVPSAKLMFVTVESSLDVVEEAFRTGAHGYVYKPRAYRDVLPILDAIVSGGRFVSGGLARIAQGDSLASHRHQLHFCSNDTVALDALSRFVVSGLGDGTTVIAVLTATRLECLRRNLEASGLDITLAMRQNRYVPLELTDLIAKATVNGRPDAMRFFNCAADLVADAVGRSENQHARVASCGEGASTLWAQGHVEAAIHVEHLWDEFSKASQMDVLCTYPLAARGDTRQPVRSLCAEHTIVEIR